MDEFLSLCEADSDDGRSTASDSFMTAREELTLNSASLLTDDESFLSTRSVLPTRDEHDGSGRHDVTITDDRIQSEIDELQLRKQEVIGLARGAIFGADSNKNGVGPIVKGPKLVDLNFDPVAEEDRPGTSQLQVFESDSSDNEMMDHRRELSEAGKLLEKQLRDKEQERELKRTRTELLTNSTSNTPASQQPNATVLTGFVKKDCCLPVLFDNFFQARIRNPKISSSTFDSFVDGYKRLHVSDLRPSTALPAHGWVTVGVVVNREIRKSANGADYLIWKMHNLKNCQDQPVKVLLFGEAYKEYWKLQIGVCVALMSPQLADADRQDVDKKFRASNITVTLKAFRRAQVVELGVSSDYGMCKGVKLDGQKCGNFVNVSLSEYCVHHVMNVARKLSAKRGAFNSITSQPPPKRLANSFGFNANRSALHGAIGLASNGSNGSLTSTIRPTQTNAVKPSELKTTTKTEEQTALREIISGRAHLPGARNMMLLAESKKLHVNGKPKLENGQFSMTDFIQEQMVSGTPSRLHAPKLGFGLSGGEEVNLTRNLPPKPGPSSDDPARRRAAAILKRTRDHSITHTNPTNRQSDGESAPPTSKRSKLCCLENGVDLEKLLKRKSMQDAEANKAQGLAAQKHLDLLEQREKVESFVSQCMSVKDVRVVSCKKCGYTAQRQSELCMREGHCITHTTAEKRFFKCAKCHRRTVVFSLMPTKPCQQCDANEWMRVAMKDERKIQLETEKLLIRGEERKFVNS